MVFQISAVNLINTLFIAAGIGVCFLCFLQITASIHLRQEVRRYFQIFFLLLLLYISTHLARQLMDGLPGGGVRAALYSLTFAEVLSAGFMAHMKYKEYELQLEAGSKLFLYTDGVPEATNAEKQLFGTERMLAALNEDVSAPPEELLKNVRRAVDAFVKDAEQFDDLTMLGLEYRGGAQ